MSYLYRTNIVVRNLQTHESMKMLCSNLSSIYLLHIRFNLRTVVAALIVVYSTNSSSRSVAIEAGRFLSASRCCRAVSNGASLPRRGLWRGRTWAMAWQNQCQNVFEIISLDCVCFRNSQRMIQMDGIT